MVKKKSDVLEIKGLWKSSKRAMRNIYCPFCKEEVRLDYQDGVGWCPGCHNLLAVQCAVCNSYSIFLFAPYTGKVVHRGGDDIAEI